MNRLTISGCLLALLAVPAAASAAPLNELPFEPSEGRAAAGCLRATGAPGGLAALGPYSRRDSATDLVTVGADGAQRAARVSVGRLLDCASVAEAPGGAAVVAGTRLSRERGQIKVDVMAVVRDPGADFGPAVRLGENAIGPATAVAPSGHAVVAWVESDQVRGKRQRFRLFAARRAPGAPFGPHETVASWRSGIYASSDLRAGIDAAGTATVLWTRELPARQVGVSGPYHVEAATAAPGKTFAVQRLSSKVSYLDAPVLSVAPDGWALVAHEGANDQGLPKVFERAPGGGSFTSVALPALAPHDNSRGGSLSPPVVAVREGGGAIVAWQFGVFESISGVDALTRETAGPFSARTLAAPVRTKNFGSSSFDGGFFNPFDPFAGPPLDSDRPGLGTALAADGRVLLAWTAPTGRRPLTADGTRISTGSLGGAFEAARMIGPPLRDTGGIAPLFLADGRGAVAWTDNAGAGDGRLHVAVEGAPALASPAAPELTLRSRAAQRLFSSQSPRVTARCGGPCDLRATVLGPHGPADQRTVTHLRAGVLRIDPGAVDGIRVGKPRMVRIVVHATAPGGHRTTVRSLRIRVARRPTPPVQKPVDVRARRRGVSIVVSWRTTMPARRQVFVVAGHRVRGDVDTIEPGAYGLRAGAAHTRFSVRLRPERPDRVRWVMVVTEGSDNYGEDEAITIVRVR